MNIKEINSRINIQFEPVTATVGRVIISTNIGEVNLATILFPMAKYKTKRSVVAMAKGTLSEMIISGKISKELLKK